MYKLHANPRCMDLAGLDSTALGALPPYPRRLGGGSHIVRACARHADLHERLELGEQLQCLERRRAIDIDRHYPTRERGRR